MPNIITHGLFAKAVYNEISDSALRAAIAAHPREFIIGSNGPDFFFFYRFFNKKEAAFRAIGNEVHAFHTHEFYQLAFDIYQNHQKQELKDAMLAYLAGHICHWALDSRTHPYIFYKTGNCKGLSASMHHRFESMIDAMMLEKLRHETIKTYKFYLLASQSAQSCEVISAYYVPILEKIYHHRVTQEQIRQALDDWYRIQTYLYDPKTVKTKLLKAFEKTLHHPYLLSGNVVPAKTDHKFDIFNEAHNAWCYPTDDTRISNESFMEIYERAKKDAVSILNVIYDSEAALNLIGNDSYDTGESERKEMKYFDLIYGDML